VVPYWLKILFGCLEFAVLVWFLASRRGEEEEAE
jgi:hypothetical protein